MKTFNLSSSVIQHENHSASRPGDSVFHCLSTFSIIRARCDAQRQGSFRGNRKEKKAKHLSGNWQRGRFQVECIIHLSFCAGSLLSLMRRLLQALERCRFWSGSGVPLVRVHSHFHFRLSKTLDKAPRHLLWQAEPRQVPRPLPLSTPQRANPTPFSRSVCFGHFGHYVAPTFSALRPPLNEPRPRLPFDLTLHF